MGGARDNFESNTNLLGMSFSRGDIISTVFSAQGDTCVMEHDDIKFHLAEKQDEPGHRLPSSITMPVLAS